MRGLLLVLRRPGRILSLLAAFLGAVLYVWYASVRAVPRVRRRKAASRRGRGAAPWNG